MENLHASVFINAPVEKVWNTMLDDATYRIWTSEFSPGSYYKGNWETGSKILFLGPNPDGTPGEGGMFSRVKENRLHEFLSLEHLGMIANGVEDTTSEMAKQWSPAYENYTFTQKDGGTQLDIDQSMLPEYKAEFEGYWAKALEKLKQLCEV